MLSIFYDWFIKVYKSIYFPNDVFASLEELNEVSEGVLDSSFFGMVTAIILTVGLGIMLCYFVVDLFEKNVQGILSMEQFFLELLKLFLVAVLMNYSQEIIRGMISFASVLTNSFESVSTSLEECWFDGKTTITVTGGEQHEVPNKEIFRTCLNGLSNMNQIAFLIKIIPAYLIALLSDLVFYIVMISRSVELAVRSIFCPIAIANSFEHVGRSSAVKYLKKVFALSMQFVIAITVVLAFNALIKDISNPLPDPKEAFEINEEETIIIDSEYSDLEPYYSMEPEDPDATGGFLSTLMGGSEYWSFLGISVAKLVVLIKSQTIANDVAGV